MELHPKIENLRTLAMNSHCGTSFDPEKRGKQILECYNHELTEDIETVKKHDGDINRYINKYCSMLSDWLSAKGRCLSPMITGPSNFPVRRNEKANNSEHNKYGAFQEWRTKALKAITRPESTDIVKGTEGATDKMRVKLKLLVEAQEQMKTFNSIIRNQKLSDNEKIEQIISSCPVIKKGDKTEILKPDCVGDVGFAHYALTNNGAKIRNLKMDIEAEERRTAKYEEGNKEYQVNGIDVCENAEQNRIQILFDGKPESEIIAKLKQNGFRWSPRNMAWQRQLTNAGICAVDYVLKF